MSGEVWSEVYDRLARSCASTARRSSSSTRGAWPSARRAICRSGSASENVAAHHGSLAREHRLEAEQRLKAGELQGAGGDGLARARHRHRRRRPGVPARLAALHRRPSCSASAAPATRLGGTPKGRLFPLTRDELVECAALLDSVRARRARPHRACRTSRSTCWRSRSSPRSRCEEWGEDELFALVRRAYAVSRARRATSSTEVVRMLAEGFDTRRGRRAALPAPRRGERRAARPARRRAGGGHLRRRHPRQRRLPRCVLEPQAQLVGTLNEDFAVESLAGDVFQLGNTS